jgi:hypothetical protein
MTYNYDIPNLTIRNKLITITAFRFLSKSLNLKYSPRGLYFSTYFFEKNCLPKMLLTPILHFFWPYKAAEGGSIIGGFISGFTVIYQITYFSMVRQRHFSHLCLHLVRSVPLIIMREFSPSIKLALISNGRQRPPC